MQTARSAAEGLEVVHALEQRGERVEIVISDLGTPDLPGDRFLEIVNSRFPLVRKVLLTDRDHLEAAVYSISSAELDRFLVKVVLDYPEERVEQGILHRVLGGFEADAPESYGVDAVADASGLAELRDACRRVRVEQSLVAYVAAIVRATRSAPVLTLGASPRGSVAMLKMAQAAALMEGRPYVVPDDVKALAPAVLRHRVTVAPELELEGVAPDTALRGIIEKIEAPK